MLRKRDDKSLKDFEKLGFKYGSREKIIYKTKKNGIESKIYIDFTPCHNNNNEIKVECPSYSIPDKILEKLYDLTVAELIEKSR